MKLITLSLLIAACTTSAWADQQAQVSKIYTGQRVTRDLFSTGDFVIFPQEQKNYFQVIDYTNGKAQPNIPAAADFPAGMFSMPNGDLIGLSYDGNLAALLDGKTFARKATLNLGGYNDATGFVPYWMMSGCAMPNNDLYFVSMTDVALVRIPAGATSGTTIATQDSSGLSGSTEVACSGGKLFIANHRSMLSPDDDQILVLSTEGKVLETIAMPGLMHIQALGDTLVITTATTTHVQGSIQFADTSGAHLQVRSNFTDTHLPQMIAFDQANHRILVAEKSPPAFVAFDQSSFNLQSRYTFNPADGVTTPRGIAATQDGSGVFIESNGSVVLVK